MKIQMFSMVVNAVKLLVKFNSLGVQRRVVHNAPFHTPRVFIDCYLQKRQTGLICKYHYYINVTRLVKNERENLFQKKEKKLSISFRKHIPKRKEVSNFISKTFSFLFRSQLVFRMATMQ